MVMSAAQRRAEREDMRGIRVKVTYAPEKFAPVDDIPQGTIKELFAWIGRSELRAKRVLARELEAPSPRISLISSLYERLEFAARQ